MPAQRLSFLCAQRARTFARTLTPANRPGVKALIAEQEERQARGNEVLADELQRIEARGLHGRLLALADAADPPPETVPEEEAA